MNGAKRCTTVNPREKNEALGMYTSQRSLVEVFFENSIKIENVEILPRATNYIVAVDFIS